MKKRKGFTLVELLAVIAILAILVIMALPAVLRMYRQSRINNFQNEVRTVYRTAQSQFLGDSISLGSGQTIAYTNAGTSVTGVNVVKELDMTGNADFKYYVLINVDGKVINVRASNGTYSYSLQAIDTNHDIKIEDIDVETNNDATLDSDITAIVCPSSDSGFGILNSNSNEYLYTINGYSIGDILVVDGINVFNNFNDAANIIGYDVAVAHITNSNHEIIESYAAFKLNGVIYYIKGDDTVYYAKNKKILDISFGMSNCELFDQGTENENYYCYNSESNFIVDAFADGYIEAHFGEIAGCKVSSTSFCE